MIRDRLIAPENSVLDTRAGRLKIAKVDKSGHSGSFLGFPNVDKSGKSDKSGDSGDLHFGTSSGRVKTWASHVPE